MFEVLYQIAARNRRPTPFQMLPQTVRKKSPRYSGYFASHVSKYALPRCNWHFAVSRPPRAKHRNDFHLRPYFRIHSSTEPNIG